MEWRVDKLAAAYEDANLLMKKFLLLKENLNQLLSVLQEKRMPSPPQVKEILQPLEDWRYTGFENRYRGSELEIKKQQASYVSYFKKRRESAGSGLWSRRIHRNSRRKRD